MLRLKFCGTLVCAILAGVSHGCAQAGQPRTAQKLAATSLPRVERPAHFPSRWDEANWKARESALMAAGLVEVQLQRLSAAETPRMQVEPTTWSQLAEPTESGKPQLLFCRGGEFAMSSDGKLHCLKIDMPTLGDKEVQVDGTPPNCGGGAYRETEVLSLVYAVPAGVTIGELRTLSVPTYSVVHRYKESCPPLP